MNRSFQPRAQQLLETGSSGPLDWTSLPPISATLDAVYAALMWVAATLEPLAGAAAAAASVVLITLLVRAVLIPIGITQAKAEQTRARLAPKLLALQKKWAKNRERLQRETMQLYADEKASPLAGCLPLLIQAPIVGVIYALFLHTTIAGHPNTMLTEQLLGVPLGTSFVGTLARGLDPAAMLVFGALVLGIVIVAEITRRAFGTSAPAGTPLGSASAMRFMGALQFTTAVVALFVPLAAGLYLLTTVSWTLVQRLILRRIYPIART